MLKKLLRTTGSKETPPMEEKNTPAESASAVCYETMEAHARRRIRPTSNRRLPRCH